MPFLKIHPVFYKIVSNYQPYFGQVCAKPVFFTNHLCTRNYYNKLLLFWPKDSEKSVKICLQINGVQDIDNNLCKNWSCSSFYIKKLLTYLIRGFSHFMEVLGSNFKDMNSRKCIFFKCYDIEN